MTVITIDASRCMLVQIIKERKDQQIRENMWMINIKMEGKKRNWLHFKLSPQHVFIFMNTYSVISKSVCTVLLRCVQVPGVTERECLAS